MQAIVTKYLGPTDFRGSRIVATSASGLRETISYDDALSSERAHAAAATALARRLGWIGPDDDMPEGLGTREGYVYPPYPSWWDVARVTGENI